MDGRNVFRSDADDIKIHWVRCSLAEEKVAVASAAVSSIAVHEKYCNFTIVYYRSNLDQHQGHHHGHSLTMKVRWIDWAKSTPSTNTAILNSAPSSGT